MKKELDYFTIDKSYGGCQEWFSDYMMRVGGCAAVTACDSCIYFDIYNKTNLYSYDITNITKNDYIRFGMIMEPYLKPRHNGIDTLEIYIDGFEKYLSDCHCTNIKVEPFYGNNNYFEAKKMITKQIDNGIIVPYLLLNHSNINFKDFEWHWFLVTGYEIFEETFMVKAVTYGNWYWLDFDKLWNTGYKRKGGFILYKIYS